MIKSCNRIYLTFGAETLFKCIHYWSKLTSVLSAICQSVLCKKNELFVLKIKCFSRNIISGLNAIGEFRESLETIHGSASIKSDYTNANGYFGINLIQIGLTIHTRT